MDNPFKSPAILSFCPGILGLERGIKRAIGPINVVAYVEIEAFIIANLVAGMESGLVAPAPIWSDAKTFDARPFRGRIHGIIGGYPCTPFSLAGTRSGENHPGHIYPAISRAFEAARPVWGFFENVDDHLSLGFDKVYQDVHRLGYAVETGIYTAEEVGAPHERERMFIMAIATRELQHWCRHEGGWWDEYTNGSQKLDNPKSCNGRLLLRSRRSFESTSKSTGASEEMDNSIVQRLQRFSGHEHGTTGWRPSDGSTAATSFPMGQGFEQHPWEAPRTIESGMGCAINGYNFREDLLRALGNSVVEQTAELAFRDLLNKHFNNLK